MRYISSGFSSKHIVNTTSMIVISYMPHLYTCTLYVCLGLFWTKTKVKTILR